MEAQRRPGDVPDVQFQGAPVLQPAEAMDVYGNVATDSTVDELIIWCIPGDASLDGIVDLQDFGILKDHFGETCPK